MVDYRTVLAGLIALAVALAPVASAFAAAQVPAMPAMEDCHGQPAAADEGCCDTKTQCPYMYGVTCCKLVGVIAALAVFHEPVIAPARAFDSQQRPGLQVRPHPPPPRT